MGISKVLINGIEASRITLDNMLWFSTIEMLLLSQDDYILQSVDGAYIIPAAGYPNNILKSSDDFILQDFDGQYLVFKETV